MSHKASCIHYNCDLATNRHHSAWFNERSTKVKILFFRCAKWCCSQSAHNGSSLWIHVVSDVSFSHICRVFVVHLEYNFEISRHWMTIHFEYATAVLPSEDAITYSILKRGKHAKYDMKCELTTFEWESNCRIPGVTRPQKSIIVWCALLNASLAGALIAAKDSQYMVHSYKQRHEYTQIKWTQQSWNEENLAENKTWVSKQLCTTIRHIFHSQRAPEMENIFLNIKFLQCLWRFWINKIWRYGFNAALSHFCALLLNSDSKRLPSPTAVCLRSSLDLQV